MTVLRSGSATNVGRVRTLNEDLAFESNSLFAVADGMGGHAGGEVAARVAIDVLEERFSRRPSVEGLVEAVHAANHAVWDRGHSDPSLRGMGTTLVAAALVGTDEGDRLVLANVGDSRAYRLQGHELGQMTVDHSVAEELVARGELSEEEAQVHPHRHILTRALGIDPDVDVDLWEIVPEEGDRFLLCSDGLSNEVTAESMSRVLSELQDPTEAAESLVRMANESGGNDNITAVVLDVLVGDARSSSPGNGGSSSAAPTSAAPSDHRDADVSSHGVKALTGRFDRQGAVKAPTDRSHAQAQAERPAGSTPTTHISAPAKRPIPRRITFRVVLFLLVLGGLGYGAWAVIRWYVDSSYFVAFRHGHVAIFEGRRGGFLGFDPKLVETSAITESEIPSYMANPLHSGVEEPSRSAAENYVTNLMDALCTESTPPAGLDCPPPSAPPTTTTVPSSASTAAAADAPRVAGRTGGPRSAQRKVTTARGPVNETMSKAA